MDTATDRTIVLENLAKMCFNLPLAEPRELLCQLAEMLVHLAGDQYPQEAIVVARKYYKGMATDEELKYAYICAETSSRRSTTKMGNGALGESGAASAAMIATKIEELQSEDLLHAAQVVIWTLGKVDQDPEKWESDYSKWNNHAVNMIAFLRLHVNK